MIIVCNKLTSKEVASLKIYKVIIVKNIIDVKIVAKKVKHFKHLHEIEENYIKEKIHLVTCSILVLHFLKRTVKVKDVYV